MPQRGELQGKLGRAGKQLLAAGLEWNYSIKTELRELHSSAIDTWRKHPCRKLDENSVSDNCLINYY